MQYYIIFTALLILSINEVFTSKRKNVESISIVVAHDSIKIRTKQVVFFLLLLTLILFAGLRGKIGIDINTYNNSYKIIKNSGQISIEPIFFLFSNLAPTFEILILFFALISIIMKGSAILEQSPYIYISVLIYFSQVFIQYDMGMIRQGLALSFVMYSWKFISHDKIDIKYYLFLGLAVLSHYTAIISVIPVLLRKVKISKMFMIVSSFTLMILAFTGLENSVFRLIAFILTRIPLFNKYQFLLNADIYMRPAVSLSNIRRFLLLLVFCFTIKRQNNVIDDSRMSRFYLNSYYLGTVMYYLFYSFITISGRGSMYYCITDIFLIPLCLNKCRDKKIKGLIWFITILYTYYYLSNSLNSYTEVWTNERYLPYKTWLDF